jgi:hypothetical protein
MNHNLVAAILGVCVLSCIAAGTFLAYTQPTEDIPDYIKSVASGAIGALAAMFVPRRDT